MAKIKYAFSLDIRRAPAFREIDIVNGDTGVQFEITLLDNGSALHTVLSSALTVIAVFRRADGKTYLQDTENGLTVSGNVVTINLYKTSFTAGRNVCEIQVYTNTTDLVTTMPFVFTAREELNSEDALESSEQYPMLVAVVDSIEGMTAAVSGLPAGTAPTVAVSDVSGHKHIAFAIPQGADGAPGNPGSPGEPGEPGERGLGVPAGGSQGQVLVKLSGADDDTGWQTPVSATIDAEMSGTSENAVQNKAVKAALDGKAAVAHVHTVSGITDFPQTMPPSAHTHTPSEVGAIPATAKGAASGVASLDANGKVTAEQASAAMAGLWGSETLNLSHVGKFLYVNSATDSVVTIPTNAVCAFPIGTEMEFCQWNTGTVTFAGQDGVSLVSAGGAKTIAEQYACATLKCIDVNAWLLVGALS